MHEVVRCVCNTGSASRNGDDFGCTKTVLHAVW